jgi:hypothetical protein
MRDNPLVANVSQNEDTGDGGNQFPLHHRRIDNGWLIVRLTFFWEAVMSLLLTNICKNTEGVVYMQDFSSLVDLPEPLF